MKSNLTPASSRRGASRLSQRAFRVKLVFVSAVVSVRRRAARLMRTLGRATAIDQNERIQMSLETVSLSTRRPFSWRALWILVVLQLLGNLASIPLLRATNRLVEPVSAWILWTAVSVPIIGIGLYVAGRIGLGVPLIEGQLKRGEISDWARRVSALSLIVAIAGSLPFLLVNLNVNPEGYPASWMLVLASVQAGVREEIFYRLFLMTILAGLGSLVQREEDGHPSPTVMWCAVILSGFLFGYAHIDQVVPTPEIFDALMLMLLVNMMFGIVFGWLYWKQGLESAILAHFMVDAVGSSIVVPAYLSRNPLVCVTVPIGLILVAVISWHALTPRVARPSSPEI
jgi:hypothetical protein